MSMRRVPAGVAEGGRFAPGGSGEAPVALAAARPQPQVDPAVTKEIASDVAVSALSLQGPYARAHGVQVASELIAGPSVDEASQERQEDVQERLENAIHRDGRDLRSRVNEALDVTNRSGWGEDDLDDLSREYLDQARSLNSQARNAGPSRPTPAKAAQLAASRDVFARAGALTATAGAGDRDRVVASVHAGLADGRDADDLQVAARLAALGEDEGDGDDGYEVMMEAIEDVQADDFGDRVAGALPHLEPLQRQAWTARLKDTSDEYLFDEDEGAWYDEMKSTVKDALTADANAERGAS